jgi:hypothetical protein
MAATCPTYRDGVGGQVFSSSFHKELSDSVMYSQIPFLKSFQALSCIFELLSQEVFGLAMDTHLFVKGKARYSMPFVHFGD